MLVLFNEVPVSSLIISLGDTYSVLSLERPRVKRVAGQTALDAQLGMGPAFAPALVCNDAQLPAARAVPKVALGKIQS